MAEMVHPINKPEEILDIVDINDNVIGEAPISEANTNPNIIHREVAIIIYDDKNRLLLQKRDRRKRIDPGFWALTAGHVPKGMKPHDAAHMELMEELGFDTGLTFVEKTLQARTNEKRFFYWYKCRFPENTKVKLEEGQVEKITFLPESGLKKFLGSGEKIGPLTLKFIKRFWAGRGGQN